VLYVAYPRDFTIQAAHHHLASIVGYHLRTRQAKHLCYTVFHVIAHTLNALNERISVRSLYAFLPPQRGMIPANETWLANLGWKNGSLDQQNASGTLPWNEWSPAHNATQPVNLTILANNIAAIQFRVTDPSRFDVQNFPAKFALARTLLSDNYYSQAVTCVYPISGTYDFLTRILFYLLLFFALLYRRHTWVAVAALGTAMTYSATTAVHALTLLTHFGWNDGIRNVDTSKEHGDPDIWGTYPVLVATVVMFAPILNWSTNVRRDKAQFIMVLWGMLSFAALVPVVVYISVAQTRGCCIHGIQMIWEL
jgi:hypothetical protein